MTYDEAVAKYIAEHGTHYDTFIGQNCHDLGDDWNDGKRCTGWDVDWHRCDCGNRRMRFEGRQDKDGNWIEVWPEAY
jgi:hypothetical protein